jgi:hypothetical protein
MIGGRGVMGGGTRSLSFSVDGIRSPIRKDRVSLPPFLSFSLSSDHPPFWAAPEAAKWRISGSRDRQKREKTFERNGERERQLERFLWLGNDPFQPVFWDVFSLFWCFLSSITSIEYERVRRHKNSISEYRNLVTEVSSLRLDWKV